MGSPKLHEQRMSEVHSFLIVKQYIIPMGRLGTLYLFTYNTVQAGGW